MIYCTVKPSPVPSSTGCMEGGEAQTGHLLLRTLELLREHFCSPKVKTWVVYRKNKRRLVLAPDAIGSAPCKALPGCIIASAGHLFWLYRQLIGMSYIALTRQVQTYRNISDPLGRLGF